jgi:hypothetical protein
MMQVIGVFRNYANAPKKKIYNCGIAETCGWVRILIKTWCGRQLNINVCVCACLYTCIKTPYYRPNPPRRTCRAKLPTARECCCITSFWLHILLLHSPSTLVHSLAKYRHMQIAFRVLHIGRHTHTGQDIDHIPRSLISTLFRVLQNQQVTPKGRITEACLKLTGKTAKSLYI